MNPIWTTVITSLVSSVLIPALEKWLGVSLPQDVQLGLNGALIGAATGAAHYVHQQVQKGGLPPPANGTAKGYAKLWLLGWIVTLATLVTVILPGCATTPNATEQSAIAVATDLATGYAIEKGLTFQADKVARAARYEAIAKQLQTLNTAGTLTMATLAADLTPLVMQLPPADQLAANALIAALTPWVQQQLQNPKVANAQATIGIFLSSVVQACATYTGA